MKFTKALLLVLILLTASAVVYPQERKPIGIMEENGKKYFFHRVKMGETIYSLCKLYEIDNKALLNYNPGLIGGLKVGENIKIPYTGQEIQLKGQVGQPNEPTSFIQHKIQRRETPYFVAKKYGIKIEDIYKYNPQLKKFKKNATIRIPQWDKIVEKGKAVVKEAVTKHEKAIPESSDLLFHRVKPGETAYSISKLYGCTMAELYFYNPDARDLRIGMEIKIPKESKKTVAETNIETIGDHFIHMIETGETLYSLLRKYHVPQKELEDLNPVLKEGFPAGVRLKIPVEYMPKKMVKPVNDGAFIKHLVQKGETLYKLSGEYGLTISEIKKYNPALANRDGLILGEAILIPKKLDEEIALFMGAEEGAVKPNKELYKIEYIEKLPDNCKPAMHGNFFYKTYHVALMLPLFLEANDTLNNKAVVIDSMLVELEEVELVEEDTIIDETQEKELLNKFYGSTENFLHFYEGVLLAVDSMKNAGMDVQLHVFDTQRDYKVVDSLVHTPQFLHMDLILGPIYPNLQAPVANFAAKNRIPMVSPLSSNGNITQRNPHYFQVNPTYGHLLRSTAKLIADDYYNSNFIVLKMKTKLGQAEEDFVELCHQKLFSSGYYKSIQDVSFKVYDFKELGSFGLSRILSENKENVFVVPSSNEGEISEGVSNINNFASDYNVTVIGNNKFEQYQSISQEYYHNVKLKFIDPYWIDHTKPSTIAYYKKFREVFKAEPNQFSVQGYDVTFYFLKALWDYGENFEGCLPYMDIDLVQGNYNFEKVSGLGGYMNTGGALVSYGTDFTVTKQREIGKIKFVVENR